MSTQQKELMDLSLSVPLISKATKTFAFSRSFMKAMLMTSFLNITYNRINIDKSEIKERKFHGVPYLGIKPGIPTDSRLKLLLEVKSGIYDAVEKNYLKEVYFYLMSNKEIQETYIFKIKYNPHNDVNKSNTIEHKESILELLELFLELGKQNKLNENVSIEMELAYYDQTPKVYEPPGFDSSAEPHCLKISSAFHKLTHINTGFHSLKCYGIGEIFNKMYNDCEARSDVAAICSAHETDPNVQEQETPKKTKNKNVEMIKAASDGDIVPESEIIDIIESELEEAPKKKRRSANSISLGDFVAERPINPLDNLTFLDCSPVEQTNDDWCRLATENVIVRCICGLNNLPDYIGFATCSICNCTVHRQCYGFLQPNLIEEKKLRCYNCQHITDEAITSSNRLVAQIRLIAFGVHKMGCFDNKIIEQIPDSQKNVALQKLQKVGVIDESTEERPIDAIVLSHALSALFPAKNDSQYLTV